jgi:IS1 family transposase
MSGMNKLDTETRAAILTALVEGNSIASTCRMLRVNKVTVLRLLADAGTFAEQLHDQLVRGLESKRVQVDEIWAFCRCKDRNVPEELRGQFGIGDVWTWVAIDADTKLAITWHIGDRSGKSGTAFMCDVADRVNNRIQLTSDGLKAYLDAVYNAFGSDVDHAVLHKVYGNTPGGSGRYSPPEVVGVTSQVHCGSPDPRHVSTSFVERSNLTARMQMRRFTRLTNAFSKRLGNHEFAVALHYFHYNFIRKHMTIKTTPAVAAHVADRVWTMEDFVRLMEREESRLGRRISDYKPAASSSN